MLPEPPDPDVDPTEGTGGADTLTEFGTDSLLQGLGGNDLLIAGNLDGVFDTFDGGSGSDTVSYRAQGHQVSVILSLNLGRQISEFGQVLETQSLISIENVSGSDFDDNITGNHQDNHLAGNDGHDRLKGGDGADTINGGSGHDTIHGEDDDDLLIGSSGVDELHGDDGEDTLDGGSSSDDLHGGDGADSLSGGDNDDLLEGGSGNDTLLGGSGNDTAEYNTGSAVNVNISAGTASGALGNDVLNSIEHVITGNGADSVTGNTGNNRLETGGGADTVTAGSGHDTVLADNGNDVVLGENGNDHLVGGFGNDTLSGGSGNDMIFGDSGTNLMRGGAGADSISGGDQADIYRWEAGDTGQDQVWGFDLAEDRFSFGPGFFAVEPTGATELSDVLFAFTDFAGGSYLMANTATLGWVSIARMENVSAASLNAMIDSENILAANVASVGGSAGDYGLFY